MNHLVELQSALGDEALAAQAAEKRPVRGVRPFVYPKVAGLGEGFVTGGASKWFLPCVHALVKQQAASGAEAQPTALACERLGFDMEELVALQGSLVVERFPADLAGGRDGSRVLQ